MSATTNAVKQLAAVNLTHQFFPLKAKQPFTVLQDVSLDVKENSFVCLVGPSGCGKSTLLRMFCGLALPDQGSVWHDGSKVTGPSASRGMVFQQDAVFPWLTVSQNIEYGLKVRKMAPEARRSSIDKWSELVGLNHVRNAYPKELSGGMRKRVDLARVYANEPEVLLMDEPFGALDAQTKQRMQGELLSLWEQDRKTVIFVTHDLEEAAYLADTVVVMSARPGRIHAIENVALSRPRTDDIRISEEFFAVRKRLQIALYEAEAASGKK